VLKNGVIDLSNLYVNQENAKTNFENFQKVYFNSSVPTRLIRNFENSNFEQDLIFHFQPETIDKNDIYRLNYKMVVTYEEQFMIRGKTLFSLK